MDKGKKNSQLRHAELSLAKKIKEKMFSFPPSSFSYTEEGSVYYHDKKKIV